MQMDYLVFWYDGNEQQTSVVRIASFPHETLRGDALATLLRDAIDGDVDLSGCRCLEINGVIELPAAVWSQGKSLDVIDGNGAAAVLECTQGAWRIIQ